MSNDNKLIRKKIGIMTFISATNYGAVLQSFALQKTLDEIGFETYIIDYSSPYLNWVYYPLKITGFHPKGIKDFIWLSSLLIFDIKKKKAFSRFSRKHLQLTQKYYTSRQLFQINNCFDFFIAGSDQVFNDECSNMDPAFFLSFVNDNHKKYTYAASFGIKKISSCYTDLYYSLLKNFNNFSVREKSAVNIVKDLLDRDALIHPDPTVLLNRKEWYEYFDLSIKPGNKPYLLVYYVKPYIDLLTTAREICKKNNYRLILLNINLKSLVYRFVRKKESPLFSVCPERFISYIANAKGVLTNSFHATLFSTMFHVPFLTEVQSENERNIRVEEYLMKIDMKDRILDKTDSENFSSPINWSKSDERLASERENAKEYLRNVFESQ